MGIEETSSLKKSTSGFSYLLSTIFSSGHSLQSPAIISWYSEPTIMCLRMISQPTLPLSVSFSDHHHYVHHHHNPIFISCPTTMASNSSHKAITLDDHCLLHKHNIFRCKCGYCTQRIPLMAMVKRNRCSRGK